MGRDHAEAGVVPAGGGWRAPRVLTRGRKMRAIGLGLVLSLMAWTVQAGWQPVEPPNSPMGTGRGIFPGRVVWARDLAATPWDGVTGHWWDGTATDQQAVDQMFARSLHSLTGAGTDSGSWDKIFRYYNTTHGRGDNGYRTNELVAVKINCNNAYEGYGDADQQIDASKQTVLALLRQLVQQAGVPPDRIVVYEAIRVIPDRIYVPCHGEFPGVMWMDSQGNGSNGRLPVNWRTNTLTYSGPTKCGTGIPELVEEATYLINMSLLKGHISMGVSLTAKNHYGSINGQDHPWYPPGKYHPFVDLIGTKHLGGKTILFLIDGLYGIRDVNDNVGAEFAAWSNLFNGQWSASLFMSQDPVAIDSVGYDFLRAEFGGRSGTNALARGSGAPADTYLHEAALADHPPSGTVYQPDGKRLASLGVHEHWNDATHKQYSRNLGTNGTGIELVSLPAPNPAAAAIFPAALPGKGPAQHPFLYAGEWDTRKPQEQSIFIVREGRIVWRYSMPIKTAGGGNQEFDDATLLANGNVIFSHMSGASMVGPDKKTLWDYPAPPGTEIHSCQSIGKDRVLIMRNGNPAQAMIINTATGKIEKELPIPTPVTGTHGQFRHIRMTPAGTLLVPHLGEGKVVEYDLNGKALWSVAAKSPWQAVRLKNGNTLIAGDWSRYAREVNPKGETVWEFTSADVPNYKLGNIQTADRLANGNTVMCCWIAGDNDTSHWPGTVQVFEVTPDKQIVWALSSWKDPDLGPATSLQLLDEPGPPEEQER